MRSRSQAGGDVWPVRPARIEVKGKENVSPGDLKALRVLAEEEKLRRYPCVCPEPRRRRVGGVDVLPYGEFLEALWSGEYR